MPDETVADQIAYEDVVAAFKNKEFVENLYFSCALTNLLVKHFGARKLKDADIQALLHHEHELVKWWRSCDAR